MVVQAKALKSKIPWSFVLVATDQLETISLNNSTFWIIAHFVIITDAEGAIMALIVPTVLTLFITTSFVVLVIIVPSLKTQF